MAVASLTGPIDAGNLRATLNGVILDINAAGTTSGPIPLMTGPDVPGSTTATLNDLFLQINAVTAPGTVPLLSGPVELADARALLNNAIIEFNAFGGGSSYTGPLDIVSGAVVAYGQRALSAAKRGTAVITIADGAGGATQDFSCDATTGAEPTAAIQAYSATPFVAGLKDQSGNSFHVSQTEAALQYAWQAVSVNNHPCVVGAQNKFMKTGVTVPFPNGAFTFFSVQKVVTGQGQSPLVGENANHSGPDFIVQLVHADGVRGSCFADTAGFSAGNGFATDTGIGLDIYSITEWAWDSTTDSFAINGIVPGSYNDFNYGDGNSGACNQLLAIGCADATTPGNNFWIGELLEIIGYDTILSDPNRLAIRQNIASYYGITLT